ncbi:dihydrolipoyl dehydrogenase [Natrarchaeobius halalkaliphilus]|uniref:Dihydrolipoyl dehydrogenase n=1 Tax=Natrarchaeobius halalkaliphilus TaxID=1679091 RepID=A0A3N6M2M6_9EURY|nr:dihydrolipoyl dehydrogenase [Natrarchaeobius halalkaliphilus]RQG90070.1 dihydrolipoyl dehydrogenase [Natrarchaeobius halalkaliphilus]
MTPNSTTPTTETELLVIGAGPAGYVAAIRAGQLGLDVTLVERNSAGGTCLNHGCIPSKAIIHAADVANTAREADRIGVHADVSVDVTEIRRWKDRNVRRLTKGVEMLCDRNDVTLLEGEATFEDEKSVSVAGADGDDERIRFDRAIVATGSRAIELPGFSYEDEPILDAKQALELAELPDRLVVVGAGYIGMELSMAVAKLGVDVTVVEALEGMLPRYDEELTEPVERNAADLGIDFVFERAAAGWTQRQDGSVRVDLDTIGDGPPDDGADSIAGDAVLVAVGREPVTDSLALENAGIDLDSNGFVEGPNRFETSNDRVFAIGDVAGEPLLAHAASEEGTLVVESIATGEPIGAAAAIPSVVFTDPEIATVGLTGAAAADRGHDPVTGTFPFRANGRALTSNAGDGFIRIVADNSSERILGGQIVGPEASELVATIGLAVANELTVSELTAAVYAHPTLSEGIEEAALDIGGGAIHTI